MQYVNTDKKDKVSNALWQLYTGKVLSLLGPNPTRVLDSLKGNNKLDNIIFFERDLETYKNGREKLFNNNGSLPIYNHIKYKLVKGDFSKKDFFYNTSTNNYEKYKFDSYDFDFCGSGLEEILKSTHNFIENTRNTEFSLVNIGINCNGRTIKYLKFTEEDKINATRIDNMIRLYSSYYYNHTKKMVGIRVVRILRIFNEFENINNSNYRYYIPKIYIYQTYPSGIFQCQIILKRNYKHSVLNKIEEIEINYY